MFSSVVHTKHSQEDIIGEVKDHKCRDNRNTTEASNTPERTFFNVATSAKNQQSEFKGMDLSRGDMSKAATLKNQRGNNRLTYFGGKETSSSATRAVADIAKAEEKDPSKAALRKPAGHVAEHAAVASALAMRATFKCPGDPSNFRDIDRLWIGFLGDQGHILKEKTTGTFWYTLGHKGSAGYRFKVEPLAAPCLWSRVGVGVL